MKTKTATIILCILLIQTAFSQQSLDTLSSDELFMRARELAFNGARDSARVLLFRALEKSPEYADIRILLARTFAWDGRRAEARKELRTVLDQKPGNKDALSAAIDVEVWDEKYSDALKLCNTALRFFPNDEDLIIRRVKIFRSMNMDEEALISISILEDINRTNPEIPILRESIKTKGILNSAGVSYSYDWTSVTPRPSQIISLQYSRATDFGSVIGRINLADRRKLNALQYEVEAYPSIMKGLYGYFNYGYSDTVGATLFPAHRIGLELFFSLPASFEASIGSRHLYFDPKPVNIYTLSAGYYYSSYWFSLRSYITPGSVSFSRSLSFTVRWYFGDVGNYFFAKAGGGVSPDEDRFVDTVGANVYNIASQSIGIGFQYFLDPYSVLSTSIDYSNQELSYSRGVYMNMYSISVGYKYKF